MATVLTNWSEYARTLTLLHDAIAYEQTDGRWLVFEVRPDDGDPQ